MFEWANNESNLSNKNGAVKAFSREVFELRFFKHFMEVMHFIETNDEF